MFAVPTGYAVNLIWATKQLLDHSRKKKSCLSRKIVFALSLLCSWADVTTPCLCFASQRFYHADVAAPVFALQHFYRADVAAPVFATNDVFG